MLYESELLFGWCSRFHVLSCNSLAQDTCHQLFGHARAGSQHDFPCRLDELVERSGSALGSVEQLAKRHTILPIYHLFSSQESWLSSLATLRSPSIAGLKFRLGILTSRFRANHPLRSCPLCVRDDGATKGVASWRVEHQLPGVVVCPEHGVWLSVFDRKSNGVERFKWHLPPQPFEANEEREERAPIEFAKFANLIVDAYKWFDGRPLPLEMVGRCLLSVASSRGWAGPSGRLRLSAMAEDYLTALHFCSGHSSLAPLLTSVTTLKGQLPRLLFTQGKSTHPLRYLALIYWLYGTWSAFIEEIGRDPINQGAPNLHASQSLQVTSSAEARSDFDILVLESICSGKSMRAAAALLNVDITTIMASAARQGLAISTRAKVLKPDIRARAIKMLQKGCSKQEVSARCQVSVETVNKLLRCTTGLADAWHAGVSIQRQQKYRGLWESCREQNPDYSAKALRMLEPAAYAWLYRNDRDWLAASISRLPKAIHHSPDPVDWDQRDEALYLAVLQAAEEIFRSRSPSKVGLQEFCAAIPELQAKKSALHRLPRTAAALLRLAPARRKRVIASML